LSRTPSKSTNAINKQEARSGKLFREATKAVCLTQNKGITPSFYNTEQGTKIHIPNSAHLQNCFDYIHQNPVSAGFVDKPIDWEFSSYEIQYKNKIISYNNWISQT
jgi:putative transposase